MGHLKRIELANKIGSLLTITCIYQTLRKGENVTQGQILSWVYQILIQSFLSPKLVAYLRLKNPVNSTINLYFSKVYLRYVKCKRSRSGFLDLGRCVQFFRR